MALYNFEPQLASSMEPRIYIGWRGMSNRGGIHVYYSDRDVAKTGSVDFKFTRANIVGKYSRADLKKGISLAVDGLGEVRVGLKRIALVIEKIVVAVNGSEWKGNEIIEYRNSDFYLGVC